MVMIVRATSVNPTVLRWARERAGLSLEQVAGAMKRSADLIVAWEEGEEVPTYRQLESLAARYKRPIAMFFFPAPPAEKEIEREFRTLPNTELAALHPDTLYAVRQARAWQLAIPNLTVGFPEPEHRVTKEVQASPADDPEEVARRLRAFLNVSINAQQAWRNAESALKEWRSVVEAVGVFVFKRSFKQRDISGFCLHDERNPIIMINNGTAFTRQIFTLFHELAHLIYGYSGVTTRDQSYLSELHGLDRALEVACNRVAAEFLVPRDALPLDLFRSDAIGLDRAVEIVAGNFNVSREVVLRRLLDLGIVSKDIYTAKREEWGLDYLRSEGGEAGGTAYSNWGAYFSPRFLNAAFYQMRAGRVSPGDLADQLGMSARSLGRFEEYLLRRG